MLTVNVRSILGTHIIGRDAVDILLKKQKRDPHAIILDFAGVEFISRSASHQLLRAVKRNNENGTQTTITNVAPSIRPMLEVVERTMFASAPPLITVESISISTLDQLDSFLTSWAK
jgi:hypothetical protein